jgi:23S rRNA (guanosine2251-2'-O)-methyltransferase
MSSVYGEYSVETLLKKGNMKNIQVIIESGKKRQYQHLMPLIDEVASVTFVKSLSDKHPKARHQGIAAEFDFAFAELEDISYKRLLMLDRIQDPHNFGACLRSAAAFGVDAVIVPRRDHAPMSEVVHQVSCGGSFLVPVVQVNNLSQTMAELKDKGVWFMATDEHATQTLEEIDLASNLCLVMGSEGEGVKKRLKELCDYQVSINTHPQLSTLNVSVATGILLHSMYQG